MFAQCPGCYSIYRVDAETLAQADGRVRCSVCELLFNAVPSLRDELPPPKAAPEPGDNAELALDYAGDSTPADDAVALEDDWFQADTTDESPLGSPEVQAQEGKWTRTSRLWLAGCALLGVLGLVQILLWAPPVLADYPGLRPVARTLCAVTGCSLEPRRNLDRIRLASRDVRAHPSVPDALIVSATLVNQAPFTQAYPLLELRLSNLDGRLVAMRRFAPASYLSDEVNWRDGMAPGSRVRVTLELVDPGSGAVGFEFAFRPAPPVAGL